MKEHFSESNSWLVHVAKNFFPVWENLLKLQLKSSLEIKKISNDFYLITAGDSFLAEKLLNSIFVKFAMPVEYMWPTKLEQKGIIEKCAQGLFAKFKDQSFLNAVVFSVERKNQTLASNIRGRLLQVLDTQNQIDRKKAERIKWTKNPTTQHPEQKNLIVAISEKCIWAGILSPKLSGSYFAGGRRYVSTGSEDTASRAAAKFVEAAELMNLNGFKLPEKSNYLELGAAPGGITSELVNRQNHVWAVDKALLDKKLLQNPLVHFINKDAREYRPDLQFSCIVCDMNGPALISAEICAGFIQNLENKGYVIFTYKIHNISDFGTEFEKIVNTFKKKNAKILFARQLYNNKQEVTLFLMKSN
ncbi:SAM-dependent methyltransferase [Pigmentibacter ruber]|nr:hypothetical protein GTC16762_25990 [Pigmentibacter ruber]